MTPILVLTILAALIILAGTVAGINFYRRPRWYERPSRRGTQYLQLRRGDAIPPGYSLRGDTLPPGVFFTPEGRYIQPPLGAPIPVGWFAVVLAPAPAPIGWGGILVAVTNLVIAGAAVVAVWWWVGGYWKSPEDKVVQHPRSAATAPSTTPSPSTIHGIPIPVTPHTPPTVSKSLGGHDSPPFRVGRNKSAHKPAKPICPNTGRVSILESRVDLLDRKVGEVEGQVALLPIYESEIEGLRKALEDRPAPDPAIHIDPSTAKCEGKQWMDHKGGLHCVGEGVVYPLHDPSE